MATILDKAPYVKQLNFHGHTLMSVVLPQGQYIFIKQLERKVFPHVSRKHFYYIKKDVLKLKSQPLSETLLTQLNDFLAKNSKINVILRQDNYVVTIGDAEKIYCYFHASASVMSKLPSDYSLSSCGIQSIEAAPNSGTGALLVPGLIPAGRRSGSPKGTPSIRPVPGSPRLTLFGTTLRGDDLTQSVTSAQSHNSSAKSHTSKDRMFFSSAQIPASQFREYSHQINTSSCSHVTHAPPPRLSVNVSSSQSKASTQSAVFSSQNKGKSNPTSALSSQASVMPSQGKEVSNQVSAVSSQASTLSSQAKGMTSQACFLSSQTTGMSSQAYVMPSQGKELSNQVSAVSSQAKETPSQVLTLSSQAKGMTSQASFLSSQAKGMTSQASFLSSQTKGMSSQASVMPRQGKELSNQVSAVSSQAKETPSQVLTLSSKAKGMTSQASFLSSQAKGMSSQASFLSSQTKGMSTQAPGVSNQTKQINSPGSVLGNTTKGIVGAPAVACQSTAILSQSTEKSVQTSVVSSQTQAVSNQTKTLSSQVKAGPKKTTMLKQATAVSNQPSSILNQGRASTTQLPISAQRKGTTGQHISTAQGHFSKYVMNNASQPSHTHLATTSLKTVRDSKALSSTTTHKPSVSNTLSTAAIIKPLQLEKNFTGTAIDIPSTPTTKAHVPEEKESPSISAPVTTPVLDSTSTLKPSVSTTATNKPVQSGKIFTVTASDMPCSTPTTKTEQKVPSTSTHLISPGVTVYSHATPREAHSAPLIKPTSNKTTANVPITTASPVQVVAPMQTSAYIEADRKKAVVEVSMEHNYSLSQVSNSLKTTVMEGETSSKTVSMDTSVTTNAEDTSCEANTADTSVTTNIQEKSVTINVVDTSVRDSAEDTSGKTNILEKSATMDTSATSKNKLPTKNVDTSDTTSPMDTSATNKIDPPPKNMDTSATTNTMDTSATSSTMDSLLMASTVDSSTICVENSLSKVKEPLNKIKLKIKKVHKKNSSNKKELYKVDNDTDKQEYLTKVKCGKHSQLERHIHKTKVTQQSSYSVGVKTLFGEEIPFVRKGTQEFFILGHVSKQLMENTTNVWYYLKKVNAANRCRNLEKKPRDMLVDMGFPLHNKAKIIPLADAGRLVYAYRNRICKIGNRRSRHASQDSVSSLEDLQPAPKRKPGRIRRALSVGSANPPKKKRRRLNSFHNEARSTPSHTISGYLGYELIDSTCNKIKIEVEDSTYMDAAAPVNNMNTTSPQGGSGNKDQTTVSLNTLPLSTPQTTAPCDSIPLNVHQPTIPLDTHLPTSDHTTTPLDSYQPNYHCITTPLDFTLPSTPPRKDLLQIGDIFCLAQDTYDVIPAHGSGLMKYSLYADQDLISDTHLTSETITENLASKVQTENIETPFQKTTSLEQDNSGKVDAVTELDTPSKDHHALSPTSSMSSTPDEKKIAKGIKKLKKVFKFRRSSSSSDSVMPLPSSPRPVSHVPDTMSNDPVLLNEKATTGAVEDSSNVTSAIVDDNDLVEKVKSKKVFTFKIIPGSIPSHSNISPSQDSLPSPAINVDQIHPQGTTRSQSLPDASDMGEKYDSDTDTADEPLNLKICAGLVQDRTTPAKVSASDVHMEDAFEPEQGNNDSEFMSISRLLFRSQILTRVAFQKMVEQKQEMQAQVEGLQLQLQKECEARKKVEQQIQQLQASLENLHRK